LSNIELMALEYIDKEYQCKNDKNWQMLSCM